ncbi:MAG: GNAT family N-acetyltransferase [Proteobacteria bacterium]|nr:GNAT family N-acetyltransferase [Pseudomonadota bacterium]
MNLRYEVLRGEALSSALEDVARLRITVFRDFPYLYEGTLAYEHDYLARFAASDGAVIVVARDGNAVVGAATGCPLAAEHEEFKEPFVRRGLDVNRFFYCAESVLQPSHRGQGAGHRFFELREEQGRSLGASHATFCAVVRPQDHPARPQNYGTLDPFWRKRGYAPVDGLVAHFSWRDLGDNYDTRKPMQFWMKAL